MDPLVVAGGVGERVYPFLGDLLPRTESHVLTDRCLDLVQPLENLHLFLLINDPLRDWHLSCQMWRPPVISRTVPVM